MAPRLPRGRPVSSDAMNITVLAKYVPTPTGHPSSVDNSWCTATATAPRPRRRVRPRAGAAAGRGLRRRGHRRLDGPRRGGRRRPARPGDGRAQGVLVTDAALRGADALVTARVLAAAIARQPSTSCVAGAESTDGYTGTVPDDGRRAARHASVTAARKLDDRRRRVPRRAPDRGRLRRRASPPSPALVTVTAGAIEPRYPSLKGIMAAKSKPVDEVTAADLGVGDDVARHPVGWARSSRRAAEGGRRGRARATRPSAGSSTSSRRPR